MAINDNSTSGLWREVLNEGRMIPNLTPQKDHFEKGLTIPLPNTAQSQESKPEPQPPKTSEK
ncbi:MAG: hypothetical protein A2066_01300 [Bacteroidetes bacterium GWB2_41_8]|nr:MAG: hypothetical protein A2066_01300 [Bacteroidetes bacterium GWB2_41_8]